MIDQKPKVFTRITLILRVAMLACLTLFAGCAMDNRSYNEGSQLAIQGHYPEAVAKLKQAATEHPDDLQIRVALANTQLAAVEKEMYIADLARDAGDAAQAEHHYRAALEFDAANSAARSGLARLETDAHNASVLAEAGKLLKTEDVDGTDELVRGVLAQDPDNAAAQKLADAITEQRTQQQTATKRLAVAFRKPVSLEFHDASLQSVFEMISKVSGVNFFFDNDVKTDTKVNLSAAKTNVEDAVHLILVTNQLGEKILNDNSVLVYPNTPQKQKDYQMLVVRCFFLANAEAKQVAAALKSILKLRDMDVNEKLNLVVVRDTPEAVRLAERLVLVEDVGEPEVMLEVQVLEVQRSRLLDLGIQWPNQATLTAGQTSSSSTNHPLILTPAEKADLVAFLRSLTSPYALVLGGGDR